VGFPSPDVWSTILDDGAGRRRIVEVAFDRNSCGMFSHVSTEIPSGLPLRAIEASVCYDSPMKSHNPAPLSACRSALIKGLINSAPHAVLENGYVSEAAQNLIQGVRPEDFEADLRQGDGNEMEGKFRAAYSSSALAVNTFAPFKADPAALRLPGGRCFATLSFERKCPHGLGGRHSPNLDVVAEGPERVVAIESKCLETLTSHVAEFSPAYEAEIVDGRCRTAWFREMRRLVTDPRLFHWLDAAQLVKHAFGLAHTFPNKPVTLLYLYWEPSDQAKFPSFENHRAEVDRFAKSIVGAGPYFIAMSYSELWKFWDICSEPKWLRGHVERLRARYEVPAGPDVSLEPHTQSPQMTHMVAAKP
jgi:hypothetical protein